MSLKTTLWAPNLAPRYRLPIWSPLGGAYPPPSSIAPGTSTLCLDIDLHSKLALKDWLPVDSPASNDNFHGVNRSLDEVRLAGHRTVGHGLDFMDILSDIDQMARLIDREGGIASHAFISSDIMQLLQTNGIVAPNFVVNTSIGSIDAGTHHGLRGTIYVVSLDTMELIQPFHCLICHKPQHNGVINYNGVAINPTPSMVGGLSLQPMPSSPHPQGLYTPPPLTQSPPDWWTQGVRLEEPPKDPVCVCGAAKAGGGLHSTWCDIKD